MTADASVRLRFAPSPTGALHLGSALVALANAALSRSLGGQLVLRIDDTDAARSTEADARDLQRLLAWLGVGWDIGPIYQSERASLHRRALDQLVEQGDAYPCFCGDARLAQLRAQQVAAGQPPRYDGRCRSLPRAEAAQAIAAGAPHVLRFAVPAAHDVAFDDLARGPITMPAGSFGDPVLCRADGSVGYLLATVVDDIDLGITHIVRGEDHLANSARQLLLAAALGAVTPPRMLHLPLLRDGDGRKLSKRDPVGTLDALADGGFLPVTVRRYLGELLGQGAVDLLADGDDAVDMSVARIPVGAPRVDRSRLDSLGRGDMAQLDPAELGRVTGLDLGPANTPLVLELAAASPSTVALRGELRLVLDGPGMGDLPHVLRIIAPDRAALDSMEAALGIAIDTMRDQLNAGLDDAGSWASTWLRHVRGAGAEQGLRAGVILRSVRLALTGTTSGPALELVLAAIGPSECLRRMHQLSFAIEDSQGGSQGVAG